MIFSFTDTPVPPPTPEGKALLDALDALLTAKQDYEDRLERERNRDWGDSQYCAADACKDEQNDLFRAADKFAATIQQIAAGANIRVG